MFMKLDFTSKSVKFLNIIAKMLEFDILFQPLDDSDDDDDDDVDSVTERS